MRKYAVLLVILSMLLLVAKFSVAQVPRENNPSEGKTTLTNVALTGLNATGVPAYIEMVAASGRTFYLYIDSQDKLRLASPPQVGYLASPQLTQWPITGEKIGAQ